MDFITETGIGYITVTGTFSPRDKKKLSLVGFFHVGRGGGRAFIFGVMANLPRKCNTCIEAAGYVVD